MNQTTVLGYLGADATSKHVSGKTVLNFSVAHTTKRGNNEYTTWYRCAYWSNSEDAPGVAQYLIKGQQVLVSGAIEASAYLDKDNKPVASLELTVFSLTLTGKA